MSVEAFALPGNFTCLWDDYTGERPPVILQESLVQSMAFYSSSNQTASMHRDGHVFGDRQKRTSQGNGMRKRGSYKRSGNKPARKRYRGQGRGWYYYSL